MGIQNINNNMNIFSLPTTAASAVGAGAGANFADILSQAQANAQVSSHLTAIPAAPVVVATQQPQSASDKAAQDFINYMKESPEERYVDSWLASHHLSAKELAHMPPAERDAIMKQMADEIKKKIEQDTQAKLQKNIAV